MMLSTSNYIARKYRVRAGQRRFIGKKLCSELGNLELKIVPTNFPLYQELGKNLKVSKGLT